MSLSAGQIVSNCYIASLQVSKTYDISGPSECLCTIILPLHALRGKWSQGFVCSHYLFGGERARTLRGVSLSFSVRLGLSLEE